MVLHQRRRLLRLGAGVRAGAAGREAGPWFLALPRHDYRVADTWTPVGMRGTGSNTLVVDDVFVPAHAQLTRRT